MRAFPQHLQQWHVVGMRVEADLTEDGNVSKVFVGSEESERQTMQL